MCSVARDNRKLAAVPKFELLKMKSRRGPLSPGQFQKLFETPCRPPCSPCVYRLIVPVFASANQSASLLEGETKNDESRILPLSDSLARLLSCVKQREGHVFPSKRAMQAAFPKACATAKIEGLLVDDLRWSAARNLMSAGVATSGREENEWTPRRQRFSEV